MNNYRYLKRVTLGLLLISCVNTFLSDSAAEEVIGEMPYEMRLAGRTSDAHTPQVDFQDIAGWHVDCKNAEAKIELTREQQLFGKHVIKVTYRATGANPEVRVFPPHPIPSTGAFDTVALWSYGNNWGWAIDPTTPRVQLSALFEDAAGKEFNVPLAKVDWKEWYLIYRRLTPVQIESVKSGGAFRCLLITGGTNNEDRTLYFDNLSTFTEKFPPLKFEPRPLRGVEPFPGQLTGTNSGPGKLPFPTRATTILPDNLETNFSNALKTVEQGGEQSHVFSYDGPDGHLTYTLKPAGGTWDEILAEGKFASVTGKESPVIFSVKPCVGGGIRLAVHGKAVLPQKVEHLSTTVKDQMLESSWRLSAEDVSADVTYQYRMWGKSLVVDVLAPGGKVQEVRFGQAVGLSNAKLIENPFYAVDGGRPDVAVGDTAGGPIFVTGNVDWYRTNSSVLWAANSVTDQGAAYNGGTRYNPLTNNRRNDCFERFFVTISHRYEEELPRIANPPSPWKSVTGTHVWRAQGASNREADARRWTDLHRYGVTQLVVTDHETMWRDGGESFTLRTTAAPGKGGDKGQYDFTRLMSDTLGYFYGPYNNYTDITTINEFWSPDMVGLNSQNQLQRGWMRCYALKPSRAVELNAKLIPEIQRKFKFNTAYCDVHTAVTPWERVDYDPRVPGAGTLAAVFYAYGEILLDQKSVWNGPVYSEGGAHVFYMGLADGNYGQDIRYKLSDNPWLVDFDLRQMHDLGCNFGMGNVGTFYANIPQPSKTPVELDAKIDRFLAATVAFGHSGFLVTEGGTANAIRSYYMLQALPARYCLASAREIRYGSADGQLADTTTAIVSGDYKRSQVVTRYSDGTVTAANGSKTERMKVDAWGRKLDLPPNGYAGWTADGGIEVLSSDADGARSDYSSSPTYIYIDGRGKAARFEKAAGNGIGICRLLPDKTAEIILYKGADCGFAFQASKAVAIDKDRAVIGPAQLRVRDGLTYVVPVEKAFSYILSN